MSKAKQNRRDQAAPSTVDNARVPEKSANDDTATVDSAVGVVKTPQQAAQEYIVSSASRQRTVPSRDVPPGVADLKQLDRHTIIDFAAHCARFVCHPCNPFFQDIPTKYASTMQDILGEIEKAVRSTENSLEARNRCGPLQTEIRLRLKDKDQRKKAYAIHGVLHQAALAAAEESGDKAAAKAAKAAELAVEVLPETKQELIEWLWRYVGLYGTIVHVRPSEHPSQAADDATILDQLSTCFSQIHAVRESLARLTNPGNCTVEIHREIARIHDEVGQMQQLFNAPAQTNDETRAQTDTRPIKSDALLGTSLIEQADQLENRLIANQRPILNEFQSFLNRLFAIGEKGFGSYSLNDALARRVSKMARDFGLQLIFEEKRVTVRCVDRGKAGCFEVRPYTKGRVKLYGRVAWPFLQAVDRSSTTSSD